MNRDINNMKSERMIPVPPIIQGKGQVGQLSMALNLGGEPYFPYALP